VKTAFKEATLLFPVSRYIIELLYTHPFLPCHTICSGVGWAFS
jgi:hypothetical protein